MSHRPSALLLVAGLILAALAGCANQPMPGENPTPARSQPAPPPPSGSSASGGTTTGNSVSGTAPSAELEIEGEAEDVVEPANDEAKQAAVEDCYNYAWSQVALDERVQHDRQALFDNTNFGSTAYLTERMDDYGNEKRRGQLFDNCMAAKGYADGQQ